MVKILTGSYEHTLDNKNRLILPAKIRANIDPVVVISLGFDVNQVIIVRSEEKFSNFANKLDKLPDNKRNVRIIKRQILANSYKIIIDDQGRITIPESMIKKVNITKNITIVGMGSYCEIWSRNNYDEVIKENNEKIDEIAEKLNLISNDNEFL